MFSGTFFGTFDETASGGGEMVENGLREISSNGPVLYGRLDRSLSPDSCVISF
jgi:hypothetical protein